MMMMSTTTSASGSRMSWRGSRSSRSDSGLRGTSQPSCHVQLQLPHALG